MSNELTPAAVKPAALMQMTPAAAMLFDQDMAARAWKVASLYASSELVPEQFRRKPANVFIMLQLSVRTGQDLFMMLQNCYVVHGKPGFEAKYNIGQLNTSGKIKGVIKYTFSGTRGTDDYGCTAWCIEKETGEKIEGPKVTWGTVKAEGWNQDKPMKNGGVQRSKWNTMTDLMFTYRAAAFLIRTTFPDVLMGLQTKEELEDSVIDVTTERASREDTAKAVNEMLANPFGGNGGTKQDSHVEKAVGEQDPQFNPPSAQEQQEAREILDAEAADPTQADSGTPTTSEAGSPTTTDTADLVASLKADLDAKLTGQPARTGLPAISRWQKDCDQLKADGKLSTEDHLALYSHGMKQKDRYNKAGH